LASVRQALGFAAATGSAEIVEQTARSTDELSRDGAEIAERRKDLQERALSSYGHEPTP
jgi:hypothetical protein